MQNEFPIKTQIAEFDKYLKLNPRGIFSAKFGDGKTHMLNRFKESFETKYEFITLYPVNYQISTNADIFELIKRDILLQLFLKDMIDIKACEVNEDNLVQYELYNNLDKIFDVAHMAAVALHPSPEIVALGGVVEVAKKLYRLRKEIRAKKEDLESTSEDIKLTAYLEAFEQKQGCIYEFDFISNLIFQAANASEKQTVLIIEDMDRLDPAQIFRILNVLAAHIDFNLIPKCQISADIGYPTNKFGFDNILIVCDYINVEKIYRHIYGQDVDFDGYIKKYTTSLPFYYSFSTVVRNYLCEAIGNELDMDPITVRALFRECDLREQSNICFDDLTVRTILDSISKVDYYVNHRIIGFDTGHKLVANKTTVGTFLLLRLLGYSVDDIAAFIRSIIKQTPNIDLLNNRFGHLLIFSAQQPTVDGEYHFKLDGSYKNYSGNYYLKIDDNLAQLVYTTTDYGPNAVYNKISPSHIAERISSITI